MKMNNIFLRSILLIMSMLASIVVNAENYRLFINDFEVEAGETKTVSVLLENGTMGFTGFETKIFLPEGLTLVETYDEDECANVAFFLNVDRKKSKHDISYAKQADGSYKILAGGNGVQTYGGTSGTELFNFTVKVAANFTGTATIRIAETTFSDVNLKGYDLAEETCTVKAKTVVPDPEPEPEPDVTGYHLLIKDFNIAPGATMTVPVLLYNGTTGFTGFETKIFLPEGLSLVEVYDEDEGMNMAFYLNADRKKSRHDIAYAKQADGSYKILAGGNGVQTYGGVSGTELFYFSVTADADFAGTAEIRLDETTFSDVNLKGYDFPAETCTVTGPAPIVTPDEPEYRLHIEDFSIEAGATKTVSVLLDNGTIGFTGFEAKIFLPTGLSLVEVYDEDEGMNMAFYLNADRKKSKHDIAYAKQADGSYKILAGGNGVQTYGGVSGTELFYFSVTADANFAGTAEIRLAETTFSDVNLNGYDFPEETCTVTGPAPIVTPDEPEYRLHIEDFSIEAGATKTVSVLLDNGTTGFTGFETKIFLPTGLSLVEVYDEDEGMNMAFYLNADRKKSKHDIAYAKQADGSYKILAGGNGVQTYGGVSGTELFNFAVKADADFAGTAEIRLAETTFSDVDLKGYDFPDETCTVTGPSRTTRIKGDVNNDGLINAVDVDLAGQILLQKLSYDPYADMDNNGSVTIGDVAEIIRVATEPKPEEHEYVDLGLPSGTLWATCNVGAESPEDYGYYFAWGEVEPKSTYDWSTYKWMKSGYSDKRGCNKYTIMDGQTSGCWYIYGTFRGDNKMELDLEDDAAYMNWGEGWRMPTDAQLTELRTSCTWTWNSTKKGYTIVGPNNNSLFLPAAGGYDNSSLNFAGSGGYYWSRSLSTSYSDSAYYVYFDTDVVHRINLFRYNGRSVRPVRQN